MNRPALLTAIALAFGVAAADWLRPHPALVLVAVVAFAVWAGFSRKRIALALLLTVAALGALRYSYAQTAGRGDLGAWEGRTVTLTGTVTGEPELRQPRGAEYTVTVEQVEGRPAMGQLFVTQWSDRAPAYGDRVEVRGTVKPPLGPRTPGGFDQAAYLARQGVYLTLEAKDVTMKGPGNLNPLRRIAVAVRNRLEQSLRRSLPPRDAALMAGLLLGSRADLPDDIKGAFRASGVFHLLDVSGGNLAMIIAPMLWVLMYCGLSRPRASAVAIPAVIFFVFLTGAGPSVMRAGLMALLVLTGAVLRREKDAINTLGAAVTILLLWDPGLLFDVGFQLSACATLGILLFARRIEDWLEPRLQRVFGQRAGEWLAAGLSVTLGAQVLVEPISLHTFGAFATLAPISNLLVLIFLEPVVQLGMVNAILGIWLVRLAGWLMWPVRFGLWLLIFLVKAVAAVPGAYLQVGQLPVIAVVAWYAVLALIVTPTLRQGLMKAATRLKPVTVAAAALVVITGLTWRLALAGAPDQLTVAFLDVGQGDAIAILTPGGRSMVIDAGNAYPAGPGGRPDFDAGASVVLPYLRDQGVRRLDYLVLTHPDQDHAGGGAAILRGIPVGTVLKSDENPTETRYVAALAEARNRNIPLRNPQAGERIDLGDGVVLEVLNPPAKRYSGTRSDDNANCIVMRLTYRKIAMLFTCDMEAEVEADLVARGAPLRADLLKVAHHGSGHSSTTPFLQAVHAPYAVISVGNGNPYGHPQKGALDRLEAAGAAIYRTDRLGTVTARTDGVTLSVAGARGSPTDAHYRPLGLLGRRLLHAW